MREIKFRAWDENNNMMFMDVHNDMIFEDESRLSFEYFLKDKRWHVMQYTGLKDKNGNEIYEGDIIRIKPGGKKKSIIINVEFENGCFIAGHKIGSHFNLDSVYSTCLNFVASKCELIGNIYENPELLNNSYEENNKET